MLRTLMGRELSGRASVHLDLIRFARSRKPSAIKILRSDARRRVSCSTLPMRRVCTGAMVACFVSLASVAGCATGEDLASSEEQLFGDVNTITQRPDGAFDVLCRDGSTER